ncbi:MAG TPA: hypothetical protein VIJ23_03490 [Mycobacterium sp.]
MTSTAGLRVSVATRSDAVEVLTAHLLEHLPAGPVGWTILSPWDAVWEGRLNLNGLTERAGASVATHMDYVAGGLAEEAAHPRPLS